MRTFLHVKAALLPVPLYALGVWLGHPFEAALIGLLYGVASALWRYRGKLPPPFEVALIAGLAVVVVSHLAGITAVTAAATPIVLMALALGAATSVLLDRPWTAEFSATEYQGASGSALFRKVNLQISALWAVLFAWLALAAFLKFPAAVHWVALVAGAVVSIALPRMLVHRNLSRMAAGDQRNNWPAPDFVAVGPRATTAEETTDVAIVGAGIGGLTAAALLAEAGLKVAVYEHHVVPGGFAHTWVRRARVRDPHTDGKLLFRFDSGVHDVSGWHPGGTVRSMFDRLGIAGECDWVRLDHRYVFNGRWLDVPRDWHAYARQLGALYPGEAAGIAALFEDIHAVYMAMFSTARDRGGIPGTPSSPEALLAFAKTYPLAIAWLDKPWSTFVARHVGDPGAVKWISALAGYITDDDGSAKVSDMVPLFGYYFEGGYYPKGGSGRIAESLVSAIERRSGQVHLKSPVERIICEDGAATGLIVRGSGGRTYRVRAKAVVCNADLRRMLTDLIADPELTKRMEAEVGPLQSACSAVGVHLGLRGPLDLPPIVHVAGAAGGVGLVIPTAIDPSAAPAGYSTLELLALVPNGEARSWFPAETAEGADHDDYRRSDAYATRKREMGDRLIAAAKAVIPDLEERIVYRSEATPLTYQRYSWTQDGSIYGTRGAKARIPVKTPIRNLVLAGAATHGPGIEAVVISGAYAAEALAPGTLSAAVGATTSPSHAIGSSMVAPAVSRSSIASLIGA